MILVTGGCGYIGSHIVKTLSENGEEVVVYDNLTHGNADSLMHKDSLIIGDITNSQSLEHVFSAHEIECVIHCAALVNASESNEKANEYHRVNEVGSTIVYRAAKMAGVKYLLYASSAAVYGTPAGHSPLLERGPTNPINVYGETKLAGEKSLKQACSGDMRFGIFRFFNVAGASPDGHLRQDPASNAILQRLFGVAKGYEREIIISGHDYSTKDGTVVRDFVHVEDITRAFTLALQYFRQGRSSFTLNLGSGIPHTILEVLHTVELVTHKSIPTRYAPRIPGDIEYSLADIRNAKKTLNWQPDHNLIQMIQDGYRVYQ